MSLIVTHFNYVAVVVMMMIGLFIVFASGNLIKRMIGLAVFQTSTGLFYISLGKVSGGTAPIMVDAQSADGQALAAALNSTRGLLDAAGTTARGAMCLTACSITR